MPAFGKKVGIVFGDRSVVHVGPQKQLVTLVRVTNELYTIQSRLCLENFDRIAKEVTGGELPSEREEERGRKRR